MTTTTTRQDYGFCGVGGGGECYEPAHHLFECPHELAMPMCDEHWEEAQELMTLLESSPELARRFGDEVEQAWAEAFPDEIS